MKRIIFLLLLFITCGTSFGQWTKPQLYSNINTNIRLKTYSPLRIAAVLDSIVDTMNTGAAGIGGSTGSVDNAILRADGTGGSTVQSSSLSIDDNGNVTIGTASLAGGRTFTVSSSDANADLSLLSKGSTSSVYLGVSGGTQWQIYTGAIIEAPIAAQIRNSTGGLSLESDELNLRGWSGGGGSGNGGSVNILGGNGGTIGNNNGGYIYINPGLKGNSGFTANIAFNTSSIADWKGMEKGFFEGNVTTVPSAEPTSGIFRYVGAEPEGSNMVIFNPNGYTAKPILVARGTISGGATLRGIGSTPQTLIAAPGSGKYINVISVSVSYNYGTTVYDFSGTEVPVFKYSGGSGSAFAITVTAMNSGADFNRALGRYNINSSELGGISSPDNTGFVITTDDGGNATTGDGSLSYVIYFTIETTNN